MLLIIQKFKFSSFKQVLLHCRKDNSKMPNDYVAKCRFVVFILQFYILYTWKFSATHLRSWPKVPFFQKHHHLDWGGGEVNHAMNKRLI